MVHMEASCMHAAWLLQNQSLILYHTAKATYFCRRGGNWLYRWRLCISLHLPVQIKEKRDEYLEYEKSFT
jgi:hypothetical protein